MVGIAADFFEIVMLAADADAFLRIGGTSVVTLAGSEKHILELVHAGVRKQQRRVAMRNDGCARHNAMPALLKKVQE